MAQLNARRVMPGVRRNNFVATRSFSGKDMKHSLLKLVVAVLTFLIGVACAYSVWLIYRQRPESPPGATHAVRSIPVRSQPASQSQPPPAAQNVATSIEEEWRALTQASFCFLGSEYYYADASVPREGGPPFDPYQWLPSLRVDEPKGIDFLVRQISDRSPSPVHVDPYQPATKGELAVYCLQHITKVNWYELKPEYKAMCEKVELRGYGSYQAELRAIIHNKRRAKEMKELWLRKYESRQPGSTRQAQ
jgi:hypothetical protein